MSSSAINLNGSLSDINSRPFQGGHLANDGAEAVNPSNVLVVVQTDSTLAESSAEAFNGVQSKPKRRKSFPNDWRKNSIKRVKAQGM